MCWRRARGERANGHPGGIPRGCAAWRWLGLAGLAAHRWHLRVARRASGAAGGGGRRSLASARRRRASGHSRANRRTPSGEGAVEPTLGVATHAWTRGRHATARTTLGARASGRTRPRPGLAGAPAGGDPLRGRRSHVRRGGPGGRTGRCRRRHAATRARSAAGGHRHGPPDASPRGRDRLRRSPTVRRTRGYVWPP